MTEDMERDVREEVERIHRFFVDWFAGAVPESEFATQLVDRLDPNFVIVPPDGALLEFETLIPGLRQGYGTNPDFKIAIRNLKVRHVSPDHVIATYEEWQRNARSTASPDNGRISTAIFANTDPLVWLHIHETRLPEEVSAAGPYDF